MDKKKEKISSTADKPVCVSSIGGQAVLEGVMMRGRKSMALCVRAETGEKLLKTERLKNTNGKINKIPVLRGVVNFVATMISGVKTISKSAEVFGTEEESLSKGAIGFAVFLGLAFSVTLFILLPSLISSGIIALFPSIKDNVLVVSLVEGLIRVVIFVAYLLLTSLLKDIRRTFMYHGAEHKTINCYEHGLDLTVENVRKSSKVHNRCGTTFLFLVIFVSIVVFALANWCVQLIGWENTWWVRLLVRLVLLPFVAGVSYEILKGLAKLPDNKFVKVLRAPGLSLQAITTKEPTDDMIEVAITAFEAVLALDYDEVTQTQDFDEMEYHTARLLVERQLDRIGAESAETDWIFCDALGVTRGELKTLDTIKRLAFNKAYYTAKKRADTREPLAYLLGNAYFYGDKLKVTKSVLIPRPETELVAEQAVLAVLDRPNMRVLDLCTGSGCIAYAVARYGKAEVVASDISDAALYIARINTKGYNVTCVQGDMFENVSGLFDVIVSNPPYIKAADLATLSEEVKKEPVGALLAGEDGLKFYREIAQKSALYLNDKGKVILELGAGQADDVKAMFDGYDVTILNDYSDIPRIMIATKRSDA